MFISKNAINIATSLYKEYGSPILIQEFIDGKDIRISYLDIENKDIPIYNRINDIDNKLGIYYVTKINKDGENIEFLTETSTEVTEYFKAIDNKKLIEQITIYVKKLVVYLRVEDYFSVDLKLSEDGQLFFIEINTAPFIVSERFRRYVKDIYGESLDKAILKSLNRYFI